MARYRPLSLQNVNHTRHRGDRSEAIERAGEKANLPAKRNFNVGIKPTG